MSCNVSSLSESGSFLNSLMDPQTFQATKVYLLSLILKANGGPDYTDMASLMDLMKPNDRLANYQQQSANIEFLIEQAISSGVTNLTQSAFQSAVGPAFNANAKTLKSAEIFLSCQLASAGGGGATNIVTTPPGMEGLLGTFTYGDIPGLTKLVVNATTSLAGYDIELCEDLEELSFPSLVSIDPLNVQDGYFSCYGNTALASLDLSALTTVSGYFNCYGNTALVSLNVSVWVPTDGTSIDCSGCALSAAFVELILRRCVLAGVLACTINLSGGTNAGLTSLNAQGQADAAALGAQLTINP